MKNEEQKKELTLMLENPSIIVQQKEYLPTFFNSEIEQNYIEAKNKSIEFFKEKLKQNKDKLALIFTQPEIEDTDWALINKFINLKDSKIYQQDSDTPEIINGFKGLFKSNGNAYHLQHQSLNYIISYLEEMVIQGELVKIKRPYSTSQDYNGFKQRDIFDLINIENSNLIDNYIIVMKSA